MQAVSIGDIAAAVTGGRLAPLRAVVVLVAYLDDSGTHRDSPAVTIAGYVATVDQWRGFERASRRVFRDHRIEILHTKDLHDHKGEFKGWLRSQELTFITELLAAAKPHIIAGVTTSMPQQSFNAHRKKTKSGSRTSAYGLAFGETIAILARDHEVGAAMLREGISFVVESRDDSSNNELLTAFNALSARTENQHLESISFARKGDCRAVQLADFLAFYSRRHASEAVKGTGKKMAATLYLAKEEIRTIGNLAEEFGPSPTPREGSPG